MPEYKNPGDAGADIRVIGNTEETTCARGRLTENQDGEKITGRYGDWLIRPGQTLMMKTGMRIAIEPGWEIQVRSRSGMAKRGLVVANAPGTIDSGYRGPVNILLRNNNKENRIIDAYARIAQLVIKRAPQANFVAVISLDETVRGQDGFGSTGTQ